MKSELKYGPDQLGKAAVTVVILGYNVPQAPVSIQSKYRVNTQCGHTRG